MDLIIQPEEVGTLARPISQHIDREQLVAYITEVEQLQIRSALGGVLFSNVKQSPSAFAIILNGGIDEFGEVSGGIRKAMAYYAYARIIREGGTIATRFGAVEKNDEYATRLEQERKNTIHRECVNIADTYMAEVVRYAKAQGWMTTEGNNPTRRMAYVVGDGVMSNNSANSSTNVKEEADIVQGEGIIINGNIISVDFSEVASMRIVEGVESKADEAQGLATEAKESAEIANTSAHDAMEVSTEAIILANNANKLANGANNALITEANERKEEDANIAKDIGALEKAISNLNKKDKEHDDELQVIGNRVTTAEGKITELQGNIATLHTEVYGTSLNLYDSSKQTEDTISPHYYVNGYPFSTTQFDNQYNATALIDIEPNTQYTIGLVPKFGAAVKPWHTSSQGLFFYDSTQNYISGTTYNTFITPSNAKYIRFNYNISGGITLPRLNEMCMLVKGDTLPTEYVAYNKTSLKERIENTHNGRLYYRIIEDGIEIFQKSGKSKDLAFVLKRKGGNNLFDFYKILKRDNESEKVGTNIEDYALMLSSDTDWHSPFKLIADNNADGDNKKDDGSFKDHFTGGNHQYDNNGSGSTSTAKSVRLAFFADGRQVEFGAYGYAYNIRMEWSNQVQGQNTTKADGNGRYILQENHVLHYNGITFKSSVELIPLEDIHIKLWYGFEAVYSKLFNSLRFVDSANRKENILPSAVNCGSADKCSGMILKGEDLSLVMNVTTNLDLGNRTYNKGAFAAFAENYGKVYFGIISSSNCAMLEGDAYYLEGSYSFNL
jgi:hypothetical protein